MINDFRVGFSLATDSLRRGNKKTTILIVFVLSLIFMNLIFLPSLINGMMGLFVGKLGTGPNDEEQIVEKWVDACRDINNSGEWDKKASFGNCIGISKKGQSYKAWALEDYSTDLDKNNAKTQLIWESP